MTKLKDAARSHGLFRHFRPSKVEDNDKELTDSDRTVGESGFACRDSSDAAQSTLLAFDDVILVEPHYHHQQLEQQRHKHRCKSEDSDDYYYPDFLPNLLQLEVPVRNHLLHFIDPKTLASLELANRACLRAVRARGYWKNVLVRLLGRQGAIERRIVERYEDCARRRCKDKENALISRDIKDEGPSRAAVAESSFTGGLEDFGCLTVLSSTSRLFHRRLWSRISRDLRETDENVRKTRYISTSLLVYYLGWSGGLDCLLPNT